VRHTTATLYKDGKGCRSCRKGSMHRGALSMGRSGGAQFSSPGFRFASTQPTFRQSPSVMTSSPFLRSPMQPAFRPSPVNATPAPFRHHPPMPMPPPISPTMRPPPYRPGHVMPFGRWTYGPGYYGGLIPWAVGYRPLTRIVPYYGAAYRCIVCQAASTPENPVYHCPVCSAMLCQLHATSHPHMFERIPPTPYLSAENNDDTVGYSLSGAEPGECCFRCGRADIPLFECSGCRTVIYCSSTCQKENWNHWHSHACHAVALCKAVSKV